jgi:type II secretory pathway pseudopilin PulG
MGQQSRQPPSIDKRPPRVLWRAGGFSLLELEVAMVVLGVAIAGLFPLVAMYSKNLRTLEARSTVSGQWYMVPSSNTWARKLGAGATVTKTSPGDKPTSPLLLIDDGNTGYTEASEGWSVHESDTGAFQNDRSRHPSVAEGTPRVSTHTVSWTFTNIPNGWYQVQATWPVYSDQATDAPYAVYDGSTLLGEVPVEQNAAPSVGGPEYDGRPWRILMTKCIRSGTVRVELNGQSSTGYTVADGVRLVPIENNVQVISLDRSLTSEEVTAHVSVEVKVP